MYTIKLRQGHVTASVHDNVACYHGIPYAKPFQRFQQPQVLDHSNEQNNADMMATNPPQRESRLETVMGPFPPDTGSQDERTCGVLSVYVPQTDSKQLYPVIVFIHGGAFVSGGSQTSLYDGRRLARDGGVVVVCLSYRLGIFGFLHQDHESLEERLPPGSADVVRGLEWTKDNIPAFGGDAANVTVFGQSAGAYHIQTLFDTRPDLFSKAIMQSTPAAEHTTVQDGRSIRQSAMTALKGLSLDNASVSDMLEAEAQAVADHSNIWLPFCPVSLHDRSPGCRSQASAGSSKDVLIGWTKDDGLCFSRMEQPEAGVDELDHTLTSKLFSSPSKELATRMSALGHRVTMYELTWAPDFDLGATHCTDLPLCFGDEQSWKQSPMIGNTPWSEWERRGLRHRRAWGNFARDGQRPVEHDGLQLIS